MTATEFFTAGTLGDTYIAVCKLCKIDGPVKVYHKTIHTYWHKEITDIFSLRPNTEVEFTDVERKDLPEITSDVHDQPMEFFPSWSVKSKLVVLPPYVVFQPHAGKPFGFNEKHIPIATLQVLVDQLQCRGVIIGTDKSYSEVHGKKCINLIGKTNLYDCMNLIKKAERFIGPEGLMAFVALSYKKDSRIFFKEQEAVNKRILNSPWAETGLLFSI